jgi:hypothetical protein
LHHHCITNTITSGTAAQLNAISRSDFLSTLTSASLLTIATPAYAAQYGAFGASPSAVLDPATALVDAEVMASQAVQSAVTQIKGYKSVVKDMQASLKSDPQFNVQSLITKEFDFAKIRDTLNTFGTAFEEDTQRGTDRLIRVILQDITELQVANTQKAGIDRSPRRLETMQKKLAKLEQAFDDYLAFAK